MLPLRHREVIERWATDRGVLAAARALRSRLRWRRSCAPVARRRRDRPAERRLEPAQFQRRRRRRFDSRIDRFFAAAAPPWEVVILRSREHLDWRYDRRGGNFHLRLAEDADGALLGYAVGNARGERGHLVDLLALPGRLDVVAALVAAIGAELSSAAAAPTSVLAAGAPPYRAALHRAGYFDARAKPFITYRPCGASAEELEFLAAPETRVHFTLGDTDLV